MHVPTHGEDRHRHLVDRLLRLCALPSHGRPQGLRASRRYPNQGVSHQHQRLVAAHLHSQHHRRVLCDADGVPVSALRDHQSPTDARQQAGDDAARQQWPDERASAQAGRRHASHSRVFVLRVPSPDERATDMDPVPQRAGPREPRLRGVSERRVFRSSVILRQQRHQPGLLHDVLDQVSRGVLAADDATRRAPQLLPAQVARSVQQQSAHFRYVAARSLPARRSASLQLQLPVQDIVAETRL